jgi:mannose-6-phosphate isomerase-like protein (cupin superfamily)
MKIRRVVTGHSSDGKAVVASDSEVDGIRLELLPGCEFHALWGADEPPIYPDRGSPLPYHDWFPPVGGCRFLVFTAPPDSTEPPAGIDEEAALAEMERQLPGVLGHMEADGLGMHTTNTIDFLYVAAGEIVLELDEGVEVALKAGDTVVQSGTRHNWHNRSSAPCTIIGVCVGAERRP